MKKMMLISVCTFMVVALTAIPAWSQSNEELKTKIEKINKAMAEAMMSGDHEKNLAYYAKDVISMPSYSKMVEGIDALRKSNEEMMKSGFKINSFETNTLKVKSCGNVIGEIGTYKMNFTMPGSDHSMEDNGKYVTIWEKQNDGSLKIKLEIWNTDKFPMANME